MKNSFSSDAKIPPEAQKSLQSVTNVGLIVGSLLSFITLALFICTSILDAVHDISAYAFYFFIFTFFVSMPIGFIVGLAVIIRTKSLRRQYKVTTFGKFNLVNKISIILCLFPNILMVALFLISFIVSP